MSERPSDYDSPWKEALDQHFPDFLEFYFPHIHADIDWTVDWESLEQELQQSLPAAEIGKRLADKLVKVRKRSGDDAYVHVEVQAQPERDFESRVYTYHWRSREKYNRPPASLVILGDEDPNWRPHQYLFEEWGCRNSFEFPIIKLLDYANQTPMLRQHRNPFALLTLAHLQAQQTRKDPQARVAAKIDLLKWLYGRNLDAEQMRQWYRYLDWLMPLSVELERQVWQEVARSREEQKMPFVTFAERYGYEKGTKETLLRAIEAMLELKFGPEAASLLPALREQPNLEVLEKVFQSLKTATTLDELRRLLPGSTST